MIKILKLKLFSHPHNFLILFYYSQSGYAKTSLLIAHILALGKVLYIREF